MVVKVKESFEKTRHVKIMANLKSTFYEDKIVRYHERNLSNKNKSHLT